MKNLDKKYCGVRESFISAYTLLAAEEHNLNEDFRATKDTMNHVDNDRIKDNIYSDQWYSAEQHIDDVKEYNAKQTNKKDKLDITRNMKGFKYSQRELQPDGRYKKKQLKAADYDEKNSKHSKVPFERAVLQTAGASEQILYFSHAINYEEVSEENWRNLMDDWRAYMEDAFGKTVFNFAIHRDETTDHIQVLFSNLQRDSEGELQFSKYKLQMKGFKYGVALQDKFDELVEKNLPTKEKYHRGEEKKPFRDVGNDHTPFRERDKIINDAGKVAQTIDELDEKADTKEVLGMIAEMKQRFHNNPIAIKILNIFQRNYKKLEAGEEKNRVKEDLLNKREIAIEKNEADNQERGEELEDQFNNQVEDYNETIRDTNVKIKAVADKELELDTREDKLDERDVELLKKVQAIPERAEQNESIVETLLACGSAMTALMSDKKAEKIMKEAGIVRDITRDIVKPGISGTVREKKIGKIIDKRSDFK